ncbi:hypothetical protein PACTADRAFT_77183 [Pachysolen tannophilus NRRL Y-2460]|uniref:SET domain-containing protein n=1 Tax=Pachysolen tannophilus NRRL Y-2460 TaxID=669874 RepID=A0A1E4TPG4_PACTA|nr:hypothetical protein PACTADRAFT_77183 [Pachysolen tannophilus NRRL Y-2460]
MTGSVDLVQFESWLAENDIRYDKELISLKNSPSTGIGVYLNVEKFQKQGEKLDKLELFRIPYSSTYSAKSIISLFDLEIEYEAQFKDSDDDNDNDIFKCEVLKDFIKASALKYGFISETMFLTMNFVALTLWKNYREFKLSLSSDSTIYGNSPLGKLDSYLAVLLNTKVNLPLLEDQNHNEITKACYELSRDCGWELKDSSIYDSIIDDLVEIFGSKYSQSQFKNSLLTETQFWQIIAAVRSRVLEIPEEIEEEEGEEEEEDNFTVNTTLVPLLDFVNHNNRLKNAYFDIDRSTKDVVLIYEHNDDNDDIYSGDKKEIEVYISYSPIEDLKKFAFTYGFIPKTFKDNKLFEIQIDREYLANYNNKNLSINLKNFYKWLGILPNIQFVIEYDSGNVLKKVKLNIADNYMFLGFLRGLKLSDGPFPLDNHFPEIMGNGSKDSISIDNDPQFKFIFENPFTEKKTCSRVFDIDQLIQMIPEDEIDFLIVDMLNFLKKYALDRVLKINKAIGKYEKKDCNLTSLNLINCEKQILEKFIEEFNTEEDPMNLILGPEEIEDEWQLYRMKPRN